MSFILYAVLFVYGIKVTIGSYGPIFLLTYLPILLMWGYVWGIPPIIATIRVRDAFTKNEFARVMLTQGILTGILILITRNLGIERLLPVFLLTGVVTGLVMPASSLRKERKDLKNADAAK